MVIFRGVRRVVTSFLDAFDVARKGNTSWSAKVTLSIISAKIYNGRWHVVNDKDDNEGDGDGLYNQVAGMPLETRRATGTDLTAVQKWQCLGVVHKT